MSRASALLAALTTDPVTTSELYDRVGYATLTRVGLVPYPAFRDELTRLAASGRVVSEPCPDGSTAWRAAPTADDPGAPSRAAPTADDPGAPRRPAPTSERRIDDP